MSDDETALYRVFGDADLLLYIGISNSFGRRWTEHAKRQPWWDEKRRLSVDGWFDSREDAEDAETAAIKAEKPKYNKRHATSASRTRRQDGPRGLIYVDASLLESNELHPCLTADHGCVEPSVVGCIGISMPRACLLRRRTPEQLRDMGIAFRPSSRPSDLMAEAVTGDEARRLITAAAADLRETEA